MTVAPESIRVLLFASYAERLGLESVEVGSRCRPPCVKCSIGCDRYPAGTSFRRDPCAHVNLAHVSLDQEVSTGDEIALLPPLAGG